MKVIVLLYERSLTLLKKSYELNDMFVFVYLTDEVGSITSLTLLYVREKVHECFSPAEVPSAVFHKNVIQRIGWLLFVSFSSCHVYPMHVNFDVH